MTRSGPDRAAVLAALAELRQQAEPTSRKVSVLALARQLGLANTTFRRRFPDIVAQISAEEPPPKQHTAPATVDTENKLRQRNSDLKQNLELAIAAIQRLTLENQKLREELEAAQAVTRLRPTRRNAMVTPVNSQPSS